MTSSSCRGLQAEMYTTTGAMRKEEAFTRLQPEAQGVTRVFTVSGERFGVGELR